MKGELIHENVLLSPESLRMKLVKAEVIIPGSWLKALSCSISPDVETIHLLYIKTTFVFLRDAEVSLFYSRIICHHRIPASKWRRRMGREKVLRQPGMPHRDRLKTK